MIGKLIVAILLALLVLFSSLSKTMHYRYFFALLLGVVALMLRLVSLDRVLEYIDFDVIGLIIGMSIMTVYMERSGLVDIVATAIQKRVRRTFTLFFVVTFVAGVISIALENVTVVLMIAPIALALASRLGFDPRPLVIGVALASNMAGSATMIGDPPAIITAGRLGLAFGDFIVYNGKPSMFFFTLIAMVLACLSLAAIASKSTSTTMLSRIDVYGEPRSHIDRMFVLEVLLFLSIKIVLLSLRNELGIPLTLAAAVAVIGVTVSRIIHGDRRSVVEAFKEGFEWRVALFLIGVFILSGAFAEQGLATDVARTIEELMQNNLFLITSFLVWFSVFVSAFIDNVPYVATMLPVIEELHRSLNVEAITLAWALLLGATLGGNLTYIGASANIVAVRILEKHGYKITFGQFIKLSIPFNTVSVITGWLLYEFTWILTR